MKNTGLEARLKRDILRTYKNGLKAMPEAKLTYDVYVKSINRCVARGVPLQYITTMRSPRKYEMREVK